VFEKIVIYGAGADGRIVLDIFRVGGKEVVGFIDDKPELKGRNISGVEVLGNLQYLKKMDKSVTIIVAIGDNKKRVELANNIADYGFKLINAIHPCSIISVDVRLESNIIIAAGAIVNPDARIEKSVIINTSATVDHDCVLEEGSQLCPGVNLGGGVIVKKQAFIGIGAVVIDHLTIGEEAIVGAGSVIINNVPPRVTMVGVPGKIIRTASTHLL